MGVEEEGNTDLHHAAITNAGLKIIELLLSKSAALMIHALMHENPDVAEILIRNNADVNLKNVYGNDAFFLRRSRGMNLFSKI